MNADSPLGPRFDTAEEHGFILLGRWLRLHYDWQNRLPALADILEQPSPSAESDPAICRQWARAEIEIRAIRQQAHEWGLSLDRELARLHPDYGEFAAAFRRGHAAYEPWIARMIPPATLPAGQLASALKHAAGITQSLNLSFRLRLTTRHPLPDQKNTGCLLGFCLLGGIALSIVLMNPLPFLIGLGFTLLSACGFDKFSGHAEAVARRKHFEDLIDRAR